MSAVEGILMMWNEVMLTALMLIVIIGEIASSENKSIVRNLTIWLMGIITLVSFCGMSEGELFGGMYKNSVVTSAMKAILNIGTFIVFLQSAGWLSKQENTVRTAEYFALILSTLIGMNFLISSGDFLMFFIGLELATLPLAALASFETGKAKSAEAGIKMILSSAFASAISLLGISIIYAMGGSIYFDEVNIVNTDSHLFIMAFVLFFSGLAFKISIVPFHFWTADVYEGSPVNVTSYLSVMSKGAAIFILVILFMKVFPGTSFIWKNIVYVAAVLTMTVGNLFAMRQNNIKRFLAFSSIAQAGFILLGVYNGEAFGLSSVIYFILIYVFSNLGAFGVAAVISNASGKEDISDYKGLYRTNPKLSLLMLLSLFSLAGIPPVAGFFGKFFLFAAAAETGAYVLVLIATLNATLSLYYYLLVVKAMFIEKNDHPIAAIQSDIYSKIGMVICLIGLISIGFMGRLFDHLQEIALNYL